MKNIRFYQSVPGECYRIGTRFRYQKIQDRFVLLSKESETPIRERKVSFSAKKIVVSPKEDLVYLLPVLFSVNEGLYQLPSLHPIPLKKPDLPGKVYPQDALFSPDGRMFYLLVSAINQDRESDYLLIYSLQDQDLKEIPLGQGYASLFYSHLIHAYGLVNPQGSLSFFNVNKVLESVNLRPFKECFLIEKGDLLLLDSPLGFDLFSRRGKLLQSCEIFLAKKVKDRFVYPEKHLCLTYDASTNLLFYVSENQEESKYRLYLFDLDDFSLVRMVSLKRKPYAAWTQGNYLYLNFLSQIDVYQIEG